jgi:hypothetical protein
MSHKNFIVVAAFLSLLTFTYSCKKEQSTGKVFFTFAHHVDGEPLVTDTMRYTNAAGDRYMITEVQYFISDVVLHGSGGQDYMITQSNGIHYVDNDIPSTMTWNITEDIPSGTYDSISFTFGISEAKNQSNMFPDPPERDMFWPDVLGGGYHYMKLNGKWRNDTTITDQMLMFHLGIGQIYDGDSITGFIQNYFNVTLPSSSFSIGDNMRQEIPIIMNIEKWFEDPYLFDFALYADKMMQRQESMHMACMNGQKDVFTMGYTLGPD